MVACAVNLYLSKAFYWLPHDLLLARLHAYGLSMDSCNSVVSYLENIVLNMHELAIQKVYGCFCPMGPFQALSLQDIH